jgi:DNA-binding CsgD family transcriptional regulator
MAPVVLGRRAELKQLTAMLDAVVAGPRAVVVEGPAGIGKTTVWQAALHAARARSFTVLAARATQAEATLSFAGLIDLFEGVPEVRLAGLPAPQRRALEVALRRREAGQTGVDQLAVSLATLQVLRAVAVDTPVVVGIDDLQWLDAATSRLLAFMLRRLGSERLGLVVSVRAEHADRLPLEVEQALPQPQRLVLRVGPLPVGVLDQLLRERFGLALPRSSLLRLHKVCDGNPFYALELARAMPAGATLAPGEVLQVPTTLTRLLRGRLQQVPDQAHRLLLAAAALAKPTAAVLERVGGGLDEVLAMGILERDGSLVRFGHPLLGSLVYADATAAQRHQTHRLLAKLLTEPEEQALHLALGTQDPDERAAGRLETAARRAAARGAPDAAAELAEHASRLTPVRWSPEDCRRQLAASNYHTQAGNGPRARALLEALIAHLPPGTTRARALAGLADLVTDDRWDQLFAQAAVEASEDLALRAQIERRHGRSTGIAGDYARWEQHAQAAVALAEAAHDSTQLLQALADLATVRMFRGHGVEHALMTRALALESRAGETVIDQRPTMERCLQLVVADEFDQARRLLQAEAARALEHGNVDLRGEALLLLTVVEVQTGDWPRADQYASECLELGREANSSNAEPVALYGRALVDAHLGRVETARAAAEQGSTLADGMGDETFRIMNEWVLGFLELSLGNPAVAHARLSPLVGALHTMGVGEPALFPVLPDEIEALIGLDELDQAEPLIEELDAQGRTLDRPWALAAAARGRGLLTAARGDPQGALAHLQQALQEHKRVTRPFELARTLRAHGMVLRRHKHKAAAKEALEQALSIFERLGALLWVGSTSAELGRVGLRPAAPADAQGITGAEARVAELVAAGRSNREVAGELFMSPKTVEAHLSRIYRKLGVRSRAELAHKLARQRR